MKKQIIWLRVLMILIISVSFIACKTSKNASKDEKIETVSEVKTDEKVIDDKLIGVIENNKECGFVIRVKTDKMDQIFIPDNLETLLQIENIRVKFSFEAIAQKPNCKDMKSIHLTYITRLR